MKRYLSLAIPLVCLCCPSVTLSGDPSVDEIKAVWHQTAAKTGCCRFEWTESQQIGEDDPVSVANSLILQDVDQFRWKRLSKRFDSERDRDITETYVSTYDGRVQTSFYGNDLIDEELYPVRFVSLTPSDWDNYHVLPILFAVRPLNDKFSPIRSREYEIAEQAIEINGRKLLKLRPRQSDADGGHVEWIYFVDPMRDYAISRVIKKWYGQELWQLNVSHRPDDATGCWIPESWHLHDKSRNRTYTVSKLNAEIDVPFVGNQFVFDFPIYTLITDRTYTKPLVSIVCEDGRKRVVTSEERRGGIHYLEYLNAALAESKRDPK